MKYLKAEEERLRRIAANAQRILERGAHESGVFEIPTRRIAKLEKALPVVEVQR